MELRNKLKKDKKEEDFKKQRNLVNALVEKDKNIFFDKLIADKKDTATIWKAMNTITNTSRKNKNSPPIAIEPDVINDFFY